jgi:hypothetical protein
VHHLNETPSDCRLGNLAVVTVALNRKLTSGEVRRLLLPAGYPLLTAAQYV